MPKTKIVIKIKLPIAAVRRVNMKTRLYPLPLRDIQITDKFWSRYIDLVYKKVIPYQWEILNDRVPGAEKSYCISNFLVASGQKKGDFGGKVFQDTDLAKWIEAVAYSLEICPDSNLEKKADWSIDLIGKAQQPDGYINTYYTIVEPSARWSNLQEGHELYTAGHLIEASVAYYEATGKTNFLKITRKFADYICMVFGPEEGKIKAYPGHQEIELALVRLFRVTKDSKYLKLAKFFLDERGKVPNYFEEEKKRAGHQFIFPEMALFDAKYNQSHEPVREQNSAEGHCVRATYMYSAMADIADEFEDSQMLDACRKIYNNIVCKKMFITGSIGSAKLGECFTSDFDLPNDSNYSETCASVGLAMFSLRMMQIEKDARYADTFERALYNTILSGISIDGTRFFYVNPLEVVPKIDENNPDLSHIKTERQKWFGTACCPPNIARTLASLGQYIYAISDSELYINLFISNTARFEMLGSECRIKIKAEYPYQSKITVEVSGGQFTVAIRIPAGCEVKSISINGERKSYTIENGYMRLNENWSDSIIELDFEIPVRLVKANPHVKDNIGKVAIMKGPVVYCIEECDNDSDLSSVYIDEDTGLEELADESLPQGVAAIKAHGIKITDQGWSGKLYGNEIIEKVPVSIEAIPYCLWNNRGKGEMLVWIKYY
jgi:DUF1680 family protein